MKPRPTRFVDWTHTIHHIGRKPPDGVSWSGRRLTKQTISRPDYLWPELWEDMSEAAQRKAKQKWATEKPKLDKAGRLRGIYFIDPADAGVPGHFQKNARRKLEVPMPAAMPCKTKGVKGKLVALLMLARQNTHASLKPTNRRERVWKTLSTKIMKTTLQGKESTHWNTTISCTNWVPCLKARKIPDAKAAVDREWAKLEQIPAWQLTKVRNKKEVIDEARKEGKIFHFASLMDICHLKYSELEPKFQKIQRPSCTPRRHCKRWFRL